MTTSTEWLLSFVIPEEGSSVEEQIAILKRTLSKLNTLHHQVVMEDVSLGMLKYMQSLDSLGKVPQREYILGELTEMELQALLNLVEYATEQLKKQESLRSATRFSRGSVGGPSPIGYAAPKPEPLKYDPKFSLEDFEKSLLEALKDLNKDKK